MVSQEDMRYLLSRGYTKDIVETEPIWSINIPGSHGFNNITFRIEDPCIVFTCLSMSGAITGINLANRVKKDYKYFPLKNTQHLPIMYSSEEDREILFHTHELILVEGIFDRIAMKRVFPEMAVFARLSKGVGGALTKLVQRYVSKLWLTFDQDGPGRVATQKTMTKLKGVEVMELRYPAHDPNDYILKVGTKIAREKFQDQMQILTM